jgi:hypothetical protein
MAIRLHYQQISLESLIANLNTKSVISEKQLAFYKFAAIIWCHKEVLFVLGFAYYLPVVLPYKGGTGALLAI